MDRVAQTVGDCVMINTEYRIMVYSKDSERMVYSKDSERCHAYYVSKNKAACLCHTDELRQSKHHLDFAPVLWRLDTQTYMDIDSTD
jgi:hypothetical protein